MKRYFKNLALNRSPALPLSKFSYAVLLFTFGLSILDLGGCAKKETSIPFTVTAAQKKIEAKCREEFDMHVITHQNGNTFWVYLPLQEPIFDYEAQKETPPTDEKKPAKFAIQYLDASFKDGNFDLEYDMVARKKSAQEDYGFNSSYTDSYVKKQNNLFTAVSDVFFNTKATPGEKMPEFFMLIITDIKKGIETRGTFYLHDFKRYMSGDLPYDEYLKRFLSDTKGGQSLIGDETGTHIDYDPITMPDFLTKQMVNRVRFKFQHSDFQPPDDYDNTIAGIAADTLRYYHFQNYTGVRLSNLRQDKKILFDKNQLANFGEDLNGDKTPPKGKLIRIRFDKGETTFDEEPATLTPVSANSAE